VTSWWDWGGGKFVIRKKGNKLGAEGGKSAGGRRKIVLSGFSGKRSAKLPKSEKIVLDGPLEVTGNDQRRKGNRTSPGGAV